MNTQLEPMSSGAALRSRPSRLVNLRVHDADLARVVYGGDDGAGVAMQDGSAMSFVQDGLVMPSVQSSPAMPLMQSSLAMPLAQGGSVMSAGQNSTAVPVDSGTQAVPDGLAMRIAADYTAASLGATMADLPAKVERRDALEAAIYEAKGASTVDEIARAASEAIASIRAAKSVDDAAEQIENLRRLAENIKENPQIPEMVEFGETIEKFITVAEKSSGIAERRAEQARRASEAKRIAAVTADLGEITSTMSQNVMMDVAMQGDEDAAARDAVAEAGLGEIVSLPRKTVASELGAKNSGLESAITSAKSRTRAAMKVAGARNAGSADGGVNVRSVRAGADGSGVSVSLAGAKSGGSKLLGSKLGGTKLNGAKLTKKVAAGEAGVEKHILRKRVAGEQLAEKRVAGSAVTVKRAAGKVGTSRRAVAAQKSSEVRGASTARKVSAVRMSSRRTVKPVMQKSISKADDAALRQALRSVAGMEDEPQKQSLKSAKRKDAKSFALAFGCALLAVAGIVYFVGSNIPDVSIRVAAMQTGVEASYPSYIPRDFSLEGISSEDGKITLTFAGAGGASFTLVEEKSSWDSIALRRNYVEKAWGDDYTTTSEQGVTIYTHGSSAAWVNGGVLYKINAVNNTLTKKQLKNIVSSM